MEFSNITKTKIILPRRRREIITRQRLLDALFGDILDRRLVTVTAPAGYGKTSLLIDAAYQSELPICWYAIDPLDVDPQRFMVHFIAAINHIFPDFGQRSLAFVNNTALKPDNLDQLINIMVNEIYDTINEHFIVMLDDFHLVQDEPTISEFFGRILQQISENCHFVILTRTLLKLPDLMLMIGRSWVGGVGLQELEFNPTEIQNFFLQNYQKKLSQDEVEQIARETGGWITAILLTISANQAVSGMLGVGIYDYLAEQVLEKQPQDVQDFLLRTSLFEEFDADLCEAVLGSGNWTTLMQQVSGANLFVLWVDDTTLRYHHLFQDFLQRYIRSQRSTEADRIIRRLAEVYTVRDEWQKAHNIYFNILEDSEATADFIEQIGVALVDNGQLLLLAEWIDNLPLHLQRRPYLMVYRAASFISLSESAQGLALLNEAKAIFESLGDQAGLARALVWRSVAHRFEANYQESLQDADQVLDLTTSHSKLRALQAEALRSKGLFFYRFGDLEAAIQHLEQGQIIFQSLRMRRNLAVNQLEMAVVHLALGRFHKALQNNFSALSYYEETGNIIWQANLLNNLGVAYHAIGDYEQAITTLERAIKLAEQSNHLRIKALTLASMGDIYVDLGALDAASQAYQDAAIDADKFFLPLYLKVVEANVACLRGHLREAVHLLDEAQQLADSSNSKYEKALCEFERGRLALRQKDVVKAVSHLKTAQSHFQEGKQHTELIQIYLYLGVAYSLTDDRVQAIEAVREAVKIGFTLDDQHPVIRVAKNVEVKELLQSLAQHGDVEQEIKDLLVQIISFEQRIPSLRRIVRNQFTSISMSTTLSVQAFDIPQVTINDQPPGNPEWKRVLVRELFFYLIAHPNGVTLDNINEALWFYDDPKQLKFQFKNAIYRLRKALVKDVVVFDEERNCYTFNKDLDYEYDIERFESEVKKAGETRNVTEQITAYENATRIYTGRYLSGFDNLWALLERERLHTQAIEATLELARIYLGQSNYRKALLYAEKSLRYDKFSEEAYRMTMRAYSGLGNIARIVHQYELCQAVMLPENIPISEETKQLFKELTA